MSNRTASRHSMVSCTKLCRLWNELSQATDKESDNEDQ